MATSQQVQELFPTYFTGKPRFLVRAPGRVNLIGEHTDYNEGFVMPMAIDREVWIALSPRADQIVRVRSLDYDEAQDFSLSAMQKASKGWVEYLKGVAHALQADGFELKGWDGLIAGNIPRGAGLSSSAAVEMATVHAFAASSSLSLEPAQSARIGMRAENEWVGVSTGIMDQMVSAAARRGHALFLDCRSLEFQHVPLPEKVSVVIMDTGTRRSLITSAYDERHEQCRQAAAFFGVKALRDVGVERLGEMSDRGLDEVTRRRARHVVTENQRVLDAVKAIREGDLQSLGWLLNASHASLRDDFEVTNEALNWMVECAREQDECFGARMTGAGFGGCAMALVDSSCAAGFLEKVNGCYRNRSRVEPRLYICSPNAGASLIPL